MKNLVLIVGLLFSFNIFSFPSTADAQSGKAEDDRIWITMGSDIFDDLVKDPSFTLAVPLKSHASTKDVVVTELRSADLEKISEFAHETVRRCPGFIAHDSREEAMAVLESFEKGRRIGLKSCQTPQMAIDQQATVNPLLPSLSAANILATIDHLSTAYTNRYYSYTSGQQSALWIRDLWAGYAASRPDVSVTTYSHSFLQPSVILTIPGSTLPDEIVVLGGHLDSIRGGGMSPTTSAPGADDNASGIASLSEAVRVLLANGFAPERTVKFMGYAGEELGLLGSGDIAEEHANNGDNVVAVLQLDMTAFEGGSHDVGLIDDHTDVNLTAFVGDLIEEYQPGITWTFATCGYGCSDHASWTAEGFPAAFSFEAPFGQHNNLIHTGSDNLATIGNSADHALKFSKIALSFAIEAGSGGGDVPPPPVYPELTNGVSQVISATTGELLNYQVEVPAGATDLVFRTTGSNGDADLYIGFGCPPTTSSFDCSSTTSNSNEECAIDPAQAGTYYVLVHAWSTFNDLSVEASFVASIFTDGFESGDTSAWVTP